MALKTINALTKKLRKINIKAYFRLWFHFRVWKFLFHDLGTCSKKIICASLAILLSSLMISCSQKRGISNQPKQQFYQDITEGYLPSGKVSIQGATFARVDKNLGSDLVWFNSTAGKGTKIKILLNKGSNGIGRSKEASKVKRINENIRYLANVDIDRNGTDDLVLITSSSNVSSDIFIVLIW